MAGEGKGKGKGPGYGISPPPGTTDEVVHFFGYPNDWQVGVRGGAGDQGAGRES